MTSRARLRAAALDAAVALHCREFDGFPFPGEDVITTAAALYAWLAEPAPVARLIGRIGPLIRTSEGNPMANPQVPAGYSFNITINPEDIDGNTVGDSLTWTSSDETDAPVTADTTSLIGTISVVNPAVDTVITATDGTNSYTYEFDGVVDAPVNLIGTVGAPFKTAAATEPTTPAA